MDREYQVQPERRRRRDVHWIGVVLDARLVVPVIPAVRVVARVVPSLMALVVLVMPVSMVPVIVIVVVIGEHRTRREHRERARDDERRREPVAAPHDLPRFAAFSTRSRKTASAVFFCAADMPS